MAGVLGMRVLANAGEHGHGIRHAKAASSTRTFGYYCQYPVVSIFLPRIHIQISMTARKMR
jgi:hypothetical protein